MQKAPFVTFSNSPLSIRGQRIVFLQKGANTYPGTVVMVKTLPVPSRRKCLNPRTSPPPHTHTHPRTKGHRQRRGQGAPVLRLARQITHNPQY